MLDTSIKRISQRDNEFNLVRVERTDDSPMKNLFMQKTEVNFLKHTLSPLKTTRISSTRKGNASLTNIIKSDIIEIDNMVKTHSDILKYFHVGKTSKLLINQTNSFNEKVKDVSQESKVEIAHYFNMIKERAQNLDSLFKDFRCKSKEDLICKMAVEVYYNQLYINKMDSLAFLLNLKSQNGKEEFSRSYNKTHSKFSQMKILLDKTISVEHSCIVEDLRESVLSSTIQENLDMVRILEFNSLSDIVRLDTDDKVINKIKSLLLNFLENTHHLFSQIVNKIAKENKIDVKIKKWNANDLFENFVLLARVIEDTIDKIQSISNKNIEKFKHEKQVLIEKLNNKSKEVLTECIEKIQEQNSNLCDKVDLMIENFKLKLPDEKSLEATVSNLQNKNIVMMQDISNLERQLTILKDKFRKVSTIEENYDKLLQEQFRDMKQAFINKLADLNDEYILYKRDSSRTIQTLEQELKVYKSVRELCMNQIIDVKRRLLL